MKKERILQGIANAIADSPTPEAFRARVQKLHDAATAEKRALNPGQHMKRAEFVFEGPRARVTVDRSEATRVEEIFFDFIDRHNIDGEWRLESQRPLKMGNLGYRFVFVKKEPKIVIVEKKEKKAEKKALTPAEILAQFATLSPTEQAAVLKQIGGAK